MRKLARIITIPKIEDDCFLYFAQIGDHIPFPVQRVYFILDAKKELPRGFHAHEKTDQILFCIQGSIKIILDDGRQREEVTLNDPSLGLLIDKMIWHEMHEFTPSTILLILASKPFNPKDYIRDYHLFRKKADN